jgi:molybdate transport system substrate-binding protein
MRIGSPAAILAVGLMMLTTVGVAAAEIRVLSIPFKAILDDVGPPFERATGHKLMIKYAPSGPLRNQIDAGEPFDVVLIFPNLVDDLIKQGKVAAGTRMDLARAGLGLAVKRGAPKPDIGSAEAFKRALLTTKSIAYAAQGPSGVYLASLLERLGIAQDVKPKLKPMGAGSLVVGPVASGEVEIGIVAMPFILAEPGVELAGPLPHDLQDYVHFSSGIGGAAQDADAARMFVGYFRREEAIEVLRAHGLEAVGAP